MKTQVFTTLTAIVALSCAMPVAAQDAAPPQRDDNRSAGAGSGRVEVTPYIEASQVLLAEISPGDEVVTYSQLAAGVEASIQGRNNAASVSLRYERNIGWDDDVADSDSISGVARGYTTITPGLTIEAGALAARTQVDGNGGTTLNALDTRTDSESTIYSAYAGPTLVTRAGDVAIDANYRFGYNAVDAPDALIATPGAAPVDVFDDSTVHSANIHAGIAPNEPLPVGLGVGAGFFQEDVSNLDQRVRDAYVRGDVTVPVGPDLALVAGVGYENVEISGRDAVRDANGVPVVGADGRLVTDNSEPRQIAFETDGLIWDAGVVWRPSRRTALEAHVGKRYDSTSYYGSFAWAPSSRSSLNVSVYDSVSGFGGQFNQAIANLPTDFEANRNLLTGDLTGCVASLEGSACFGNAFNSVRSSTFRGRGVVASYARQIGRFSTGIGAGYDRRKFIAAPGTILASANGVVDESYFLTSYFSGQLDARSSFSVNAYANWLNSGFDGGDTTVLGASAAYSRNLLAGLSARAAVGVDYLDTDAAGDDLTTASALFGLRYDF
ncbi:preprotein translocase subunit YajC [Alteripontixanthobacter maritimus]|nr:preprotein translocase subunit YajC [Alteripontixanthobacter maritimus]